MNPQPGGASAALCFSSDPAVSSSIFVGAESEENLKLLYCLTARGSAREMKKRRTHQFQTVRIRNNFFYFYSLQEAQRWSLPAHEPVNRLDNVWAYFTPALSWLLQVLDDAIIWPWDIFIIRESIFSVGLLLSPYPILAAQDYRARTVYGFLQWIVFSWFLTFHSSHQPCSCNLVRGRSARSRWELKMSDRVFLQGHVTVVAILFQSVLTAHALFHMNEDPMRILMLTPPPLSSRNKILKYLRFWLRYQFDAFWHYTFPSIK